MEKLYQILPHFLQNIMISMFNYLAYRKRYGGNYPKYLQLFKDNNTLTTSELKSINSQKLVEIISYANANSRFYNKLYKNINLQLITDSNDIKLLPIVNKEQLRTSIHDVYTIKKSEGIISKTGGTTGKSLEVLCTKNDMQERFAMLDNFRGNFGYKLGKKTAWFSGKNLLTRTDINKNRFWKTDILYNVRYYSTFHIKNNYLQFYIDDLLQFKPMFIVGFPSSLVEIAKYGLQNNIQFPENTIQCIFPTAETITDEIRYYLETFFKTKVYDQYASSEGAPFIFECKNGKLHLELQSGVFEVLDENNNDALSGKLVVTSFTTHGTPLIRYDIEDSVTLSDEKCNCGNHNPLVNKILGRMDDYVYSPTNGKINLGNVSNTLKDTKGVVKFQVVQNEMNAITINMVIDNTIFTSETEKIFLKNWKDRLGTTMEIKLHYVNDIPVEKSGKFRMVVSNIKHLVDNK